MNDKREYKGVVKFFDRTRGFGFIAGDDGKDYFVHYSDLADLVLDKNDNVTFTLGKNQRGVKAINVKRI